MRFGIIMIIMIIATCWLCVQFNRCVQLVPLGSDGKPIYDLPAVTQEELDAAHAARAEHIRQEGLSAVPDSIDLRVEDDDYDLKLKTKGLSDTRVMHFRVTPGASFGWQTHPGPTFVVITAGTLTYYDPHDPADGVDYEAGTGFVDEGGGGHDVRNEGDTDVELVAFFLTPQDTPIRTDAPQP